MRQLITLKKGMTTMKLLSLILIISSTLLVSCGGDSSNNSEAQAPQVSVDTLLDKLNQNLNTYEPQKVGYQNVMEETSTVVYGNSDGTSITCQYIDTKTETILEVREDAVLLHRKEVSRPIPNNPSECARFNSNQGPVLVLVNKHTKESILEDFRSSIDSGDINLQSIGDLGSNRYIINISSVVSTGSDNITVDATITVDFGVPYFMMNLESVGTARGFNNRTVSRRVDYLLDANTRGLRQRGMTTIDERD